MSNYEATRYNFDGANLTDIVSIEVGTIMPWSDTSVPTGYLECNGAEVSVIDQGYDFNTNALTVGRNGSNIANSAADLTINTQGAGFTLVYSGDATTGWTYKEK